MTISEPMDSFLLDNTDSEDPAIAEPVISVDQTICIWFLLAVLCVNNCALYSTFFYRKSVAIEQVNDNVFICGIVSSR